MATTPKIDMEELAASYGYSYAVLNSNSELRHIFQKAIREKWTDPQRFVAAVRNTKWYQKHSESWRQSFLLQKTDPAEYARRRQQMATHIRNVYTQMTGGAELGQNFLKAATTQAINFGWTEEEIKQHIAHAVGYATLMAKDALGGDAGQLEDAIRKAMGDYGVNVSNGWIANRIKNTMLGTDSHEAIMDSLKKMAKAKYRAFSDQIDQGMTVKDLAEPYMQSMAKVLEINPESIDIHDHNIQQALTSHDPKNGAPMTMPVWQFEQNLRNDPRWNRTQNAQDAMMSAGHSLLQQFGIVS